MSPPSVAALRRLRHELHRYPDLSGDEGATAERILRFFQPLQPDECITGIGGHGLAFVFAGTDPGPTVLLRCELDALPITETNTFPHASVARGVSHKCGHDGHMAILAAVGTELARQRPSAGRVVLLFQPAEETGAGAAAILADPRFPEIKSDFAFALHNLPGYPTGEVIVREGVFCCASRGMIVRLNGIAAHAAQPQTGVSPAGAMCRIIDGLNELPRAFETTGEFVMATVVAAKLGEKAFGTAPGYAEVMATLRCERDEVMARLVERAEQLVAGCATGGLRCEIEYEDGFPATVNSDRAVALVRRACSAGRVTTALEPFRWSEDFAHFTAIAEAALFGLGAGESTPDLHSPGYDFPDELIERGTTVLLDIVTECMST